jgi:hypothetical protein
MNISDIQRILSKTGYYAGGIDNDLGPLTQNAIEVIERTQAHQYPKAKRWGWKRRGIAAAQACLNVWGFEAGSVDGQAGVNTLEAFRAWEYKNVNGKREVVNRPERKSYEPSKTIRRPRQRDVENVYGTAGKNSGTIRKRLKTIKLPFKLRIDYNLRQSTNKITVHKDVADDLEAALIEVHEHYGMDEMRRLGIDRYAGAYNPRKMRGGSRWSMHAYGIAIDFFAAPNGLRVSCPKALFCGDEYKPFLDIMEKHGWLPALRLWGKDAMHFQAARL